MEEVIKQALNANVDLSKEDYAKLSSDADQSTEKHGVKGKAPVSESLRHKRIQSNYYGTSVNIGMQTLAALGEIEELLRLIARKLYQEEVGNGRADEDKR